MSILIKNGRVIDPKNNIDDILDVLIIENKIDKIEKNIDFSAEEIIDGTGLWVTAGFIDLHVHLREPGFEYKETIKSGSESGVIGGFTTICAMPNTNPVIDNKEMVDFVIEKGKTANLLNVLPIGSITKSQDGIRLTDFEEMKKAGIIALTEDGKTVNNAFLMKEAFLEAKKLDLNILSHCEDLLLTNGGAINEGKKSIEFNLKGVSNISEYLIVARDILLASSLNAKLHICHVSTKESIEIIKEAKKRNKNITCEVAPHHFSLTEEDIKQKDANFKMAPPLRSKADLESILNAFKEDIIDVIATDHAPHSKEEKELEFSKAPNGIVGLETAFSLGITNLVDKNILSPLKFIKKLTINPAKVIGIDKGTLEVGKIADITISNPNLEYTIKTKDFKSKSKNSPFNNFCVRGKVLFTIVNGRIVVKNGELF